MTIDDDEQNPWRWIGTARIGQPSELIVSDRWGQAHIQTPAFLNDDGFWYLIDPPRQMFLRPVAWRYAMNKQKSPGTVRHRGSKSSDDATP